jgi:hypothetical protein
MCHLILTELTYFVDTYEVNNKKRRRGREYKTPGELAKNQADTLYVLDFGLLKRNLYPTQSSNSLVFVLPFCIYQPCNFTSRLKR